MEPRTDAGEPSPRARGWRWPVLCWLVILVLIGVVQIVRQQFFDATVFLFAIALMGTSVVLPVLGRGIHPPVVVISATVLAIVAALLPRHSAGMIAAVLITGVLALVAAWPGAASAPRVWTPGLRRLALAWAVILIVGCLWELAEFVSGLIAPQHPSFALSDLVDPLLDTELGKAIFAGAWLSCGAFLALRGRSR